MCGLPALQGSFPDPRALQATAFWWELPLVEAGHSSQRALKSVWKSTGRFVPELTLSAAVFQVYHQQELSLQPNIPEKPN